MEQILIYVFINILFYKIINNVVTCNKFEENCRENCKIHVRLYLLTEKIFVIIIYILKMFI